MTDPGQNIPYVSGPTAPDHQATPQPRKKRLPLPWIVGCVVVAVALCSIGALALAVSPDTTKPPAATTATTAPAATTRPAAAQPTVAATTAAAPAAQPEPLPADQVFSGRGAKVVKLTLTEDYVYVATITHTGRSNFVVWTVDAAGDEQHLLVNTIGNYAGVRPVDLKETPAALEIKADGTWKILVQVAQKAPVWTGKASGKGAAVLRMTDLTQGLATVKITHSGRSNFVVWVYGDNSELLVNDIGNYSGEVLLPPGMILIEIVADGAWTFERVG